MRIIFRLSFEFLKISSFLLFLEIFPISKNIATPTNIMKHSMVNILCLFLFGTLGLASNIRNTLDTHDDNFQTTLDEVLAENPLDAIEEEELSVIDINIPSFFNDLSYKIKTSVKESAKEIRSSTNSLTVLLSPENIKNELIKIATEFKANANIIKEKVEGAITKTLDVIQEHVEKGRKLRKLSSAIAKITVDRAVEAIKDNIVKPFEHLLQQFINVKEDVQNKLKKASANATKNLEDLMIVFMKKLKDLKQCVAQPFIAIKNEIQRIAGDTNDWFQRTKDAFGSRIKEIKDILNDMKQDQIASGSNSFDLKHHIQKFKSGILKNTAEYIVDTAPNAIKVFKDTCTERMDTNNNKERCITAMNDYSYTSSFKRGGCDLVKFAAGASVKILIWNRSILEKIIQSLNEKCPTAIKKIQSVLSKVLTLAWTRVKETGEFLLKKFKEVKKKIYAALFPSKEEVSGGTDENGDISSHDNVESVKQKCTCYNDDTDGTIVDLATNAKECIGSNGHWQVFHSNLASKGLHPLRTLQEFLVCGVQSKYAEIQLKAAQLPALIEGKIIQFIETMTKR